MVTFKRLGKNRRLVLRFEWLTLWPVCAVFPVRSHRRDMVNFLVFPKRAPRSHGTKPIPVEERVGRIVISAASVKLTARVVINNHTKDAFSIDGNHCGSTRNMRSCRPLG